MSASDPQFASYTRTAIVLHWVIAPAVIVQFTWGWVMQTIPKQPPGMRVFHSCTWVTTSSKPTSIS